MDNGFVYETALRQSAYDMGCRSADFLKKENITVRSVCNSKARKYLELPFVCNLVTYGTNVVASVDAQYEKEVRDRLGGYDRTALFENPYLLAADNAFKGRIKTCLMSEYWLPDIGRIGVHECGYDLRLLFPVDFGGLYRKEWSDALCEKRKELDVLGTGAYDNGRLVGLAACSADCEDMWQIGINVLPEYRRQGIAAALTSRLSAEILKRGKIPFYCCAWSNIASAANAVKCGFRPAWAEVTFKL